MAGEPVPCSLLLEGQNAKPMQIELNEDCAGVRWGHFIWPIPGPTSVGQKLKLGVGSSIVEIVIMVVYEHSVLFASVAANWPESLPAPAPRDL